MAQVVAEWMTHGYPRVIDSHGADVARFYDEEKSDEHIWARASEHFNKTYGIVHPAEQWESRRHLVEAPFKSRQEALGAEFFQARVWERPQWYTSNADLVERYGLTERPVEWDNRWWSPITVAEHLNLRENCGLIDLSAFQIYELEGPGAVAFADYLAVNKIDVPVGRSVYTPWLNQDGGFHSDLTMMRMAEDRVRIVTGVFDGGRDEFWVRKHMPNDGSVTFTNLTKQISTLGLWGRTPRPCSVSSPITISPTRARRTARTFRSPSPASSATCSASPMSATPAGRSTCRGTRRAPSSTRSWKPARTTVCASPVAACTRCRVASRRATA